MAEQGLGASASQRVERGFYCKSQRGGRVCVASSGREVVQVPSLLVYNLKGAAGPKPHLQMTKLGKKGANRHHWRSYPVPMLRRLSLGPACWTLGSTQEALGLCQPGSAEHFLKAVTRSPKPRNSVPKDVELDTKALPFQQGGPGLP
jgi:hypothetical protein